LILSPKYDSKKTAGKPSQSETEVLGLQVSIDKAFQLGLSKGHRRGTSQAAALFFNFGNI